ncbi:MAG: site-specific integrase [Chloroflexota bacterium]|nr:site-specific integrase [Chloroflexota bacterium]
MRRDTPLDVVIESFFRANYDLAPKTEEYYRSALAGFCAWVRKIRKREPLVADLERVLVNAYLKERIATPTRKYPAGSAFAARAASVSLKRFANFLAAEGILQDARGQSVLAQVRRTKVDEDVRRPLADDELERVLATSGRPGDRDRTIVVFLAGTGLRSNEAREARLADLDLAACTFTVRPETSKFGRSRTVQFHPAVARELDRYLSTRGEAQREAPLFPTDEDRTFTTEGWEKVFQRIRTRAGVPNFNAHVLRHTWATNFMRQAGADLLQLKRLGGWSRWEMVERYSHAIPVRDRDALPNPLAKASSNASKSQPPVRARSALTRLTA